MAEAADSGTLPAGTRRVHVALTFGLNYAYLFDDVSLILAAPNGPPVIDPAGIVSASAFGGATTVALGPRG